jgi:hypothetical protein
VAGCHAAALLATDTQVAIGGLNAAVNNFVIEVAALRCQASMPAC